MSVYYSLLQPIDFGKCGCGMWCVLWGVDVFTWEREWERMGVYVCAIVDVYVYVSLCVCVCARALDFWLLL